MMITPAIPWFTVYYPVLSGRDVSLGVLGNYNNARSAKRAASGKPGAFVVKETETGYDAHGMVVYNRSLA